MSRALLHMTVALALLSGSVVVAQDTPPPAEPAPEPQFAPLRQVQIQVWITQTDEDGTRDIGNQLNYTRFTRGVEHSGSVERIRTDTFEPMERLYDAVLPAPDFDPYTLDSSGNIRLTPESNTLWTPGNTLTAGPRGEAFINTRRGAGLTYNIIDSDKGTIEGLMRGIETRTDSDLISKPELLVIDRTPAQIVAGEEIPYQAVTYKNGLPQLSINWQNVGVDMELTPEIASDDLIKLNIGKLNVVDELAERPIVGLQVPVFSTRSQTGAVMVPNGQMIVIGGLMSQIEKRTEKRVPIIGKIPVLGVLFRGRETETQKSHLLIFVSPTVVDLRDYTNQMDQAMNFWREDQWKHLNEIQEEIDLMPAGL